MAKTDIAELYRTIAAEVLLLEEADAERQGDKPTSRPHPPASEEAIAAAEKARKRTFIEPYRAFLRTFDGWTDFSWSISLFGTEELACQAREDYWESFEYGDPLSKELAEGLLIGVSENDATCILLLESGEVVDWLYSEQQRFADLASYLSDRKAVLLEVAEAARACKATAEAGWDPKFRAEEEKALETELTNVLRDQAATRVSMPAGEGRPAVPRPGRHPARKAVATRELVLRKEKEIVAEVGLRLVLYLGATPTRDEVVATFRAFRKRFPVRGKLEWAPASQMTFLTHQSENPDDEAFVAALKVDDGGHFGLRAQITLDEKSSSKDSQNIYYLNVRGVPPADSPSAGEDETEASPKDRSRASFVEVFVSADADPAALYALSRDLVDILPVRSGHGGWFAQVWDRDAEPDPDQAVFTWCRRFFGVEVAYVDGWLAAAHRRLRGANWLTVLGKTFAKVLDGAKALGSLESAVDRYDGKYGVVFHAGEVPPLCDVEREDLPRGIVLVARAIEPLMVGGFSQSGHISAGGIYFSTFTSEVPTFADHHATDLHLHRFTCPEAFLGPTPLEEAEALLEELCARTGHDTFKEWTQNRKKCIPRGFKDLLLALYNESCAVATTPLGTKALELAARYPEWAAPQVYNNLLFVYLAAKRYQDGLDVMPVALRTARRCPSTYHNAACIFAFAGKPDEALECVRLAKEHGYKNFARMKDDADLAPIAGWKSFQALFEPAPTSPKSSGL